MSSMSSSRFAARCVLTASIVVAPLVAAVAASLVASFAACSSFSASDSPTSATDGGEAGNVDDDAASETGVDAVTCDASFASDPNHCGKCGHSCFGGACVGGECQPVAIGATTGEDVLDVALDAQRVMWLTATRGGWTNPGHVYGCPYAGCADAAPIPLATSDALGNLAGDGKNAFFSQSYGPPALFAIQPTGTPQAIGPGHTEAVLLQIRGGLLYYVTLYDGGGGLGRYVGHVYRWDGANELLVSQFDSGHNLNDMVVVGDRAFFSGAEYLTSCPLGDGLMCLDPAPFVQASSTEYLSLTTDGKSVIWTDSKSVFSCPSNRPSCATPSALLGPANKLGADVLSLTFDHGNLYISTAGNDIFVCTLPDCGGTLRKLVHEARLFQTREYVYGHSLAADDVAVYWAAVDGMEVSDGDGGLDASGLVHRIMKLAK